MPTTERPVYESAFAVAMNDHPMSLASARNQSHDTVIANTGAGRRSGVEWSYYEPARTAQFQLLAEGCDIILPSDVAAVCRVWPEGVLVVATVEVEP